MTKKIFYLLLITSLSACNNSQDKNAEVKDTAAEREATSPTNNIAIPGKLCFQRILQKDTIAIELFIKDTSVNGNLIYNFYEKDSNKGTFKGSIHNDIIKADYTYLSEGKASVREVIFKLKDGVLIEGFGATLMQGNKFIFKDTSKIQYTQVFEPVDCK